MRIRLVFSLNPDPAYAKISRVEILFRSSRKLDLDLTLGKKPGSRFYLIVRLLLFSFDIKVNITDILILNYHFGQ